MNAFFGKILGVFTKIFGCKLANLMPYMFENCPMIHTILRCITFSTAAYTTHSFINLEGHNLVKHN